MVVASQDRGLTDEEAPLLQQTNNSDHDADREKKETPIPWSQFSIVLVLQLAEPMSSNVIYPFLPHLVRETGITRGDEKKVGYYVGIMQSIFFAAQALTVLQWSRISDRVGRKPIILIGLSGLSLSMICFGLSKTFPALVVARSLNGLLNGVIVVMKSMIGELTDSTNIARAYSYQPISWSTGATLGPLIGGALSHPVEHFPKVFGGNQFLEKYPYFLPCAIPACFCVVAWFVTLMFLRETNRTGFTLRSLLPSSFIWSKKSNPEASISAKRRPPIPDVPPLRSILTRPVILSTTAYALFSVLDIAFRSLLPVFYATPRTLGGLGLSPRTIGILFAAWGLAMGIFQICCFAKLVKRWGPRRVYLVGSMCAAPVYALFPVMSAAVRIENRSSSDSGGFSAEAPLGPVLASLVTLQLATTFLFSICHGAVFIYITAAGNAIPQKSRSARRIIHPTGYQAIRTSSSSSAALAPSSSTQSPQSVQTHTQDENLSSERNARPKPKLEKGKGNRSGSRTLGAVNGFAQLTVSIMRCVGPYGASSLFARGLSWEYGPGAGSGLPDDGPITEPLPDLEAFSTGVGIQELIGGMNLEMEGRNWIMRRLGGMLVYAVMIAFVGVAIAVGSRLPEVPWTPADDDNESDDLCSDEADRGNDQDNEE